MPFMESASIPYQTDITPAPQPRIARSEGYAVVHGIAVDEKRSSSPHVEEVRQTRYVPLGALRLVIR